MSYAEIEVKIKIWGKNEGEYIDLINGTDEKHIFISTDVDGRNIEINIEELQLALRKIKYK